MIKLLSSILFGLVLGWFFHYLYNNSPQDDSHHLLTKTDCTDSYEVVEKIVIQKVIEYVPKIKIVYKTKKVEKKDDNNSKDLFFIALEKKEFDTAMRHYEEADEEKYPSYRSALYAYFEKMQLKSPLQTIEEMQTFIELEPENKLFVFQLTKLFEKKGEYNLALDLLVDLRYLVSFNEQKSIHTRIKSISKSYIGKLNEAENFKDLIDFLMTRMNIGILSEFYSYELAKVYLKLKKYYESIEVLQLLKYNELYKERAIALLNYVQLKLEEQEEYPIQIPLIRYGLHFLVKAKVDNIEVTLMLDTGASTTTIDIHKIQYLPIIRENVLFHTAAGKLYENIHQAREFKIGSTILTDFSVSASHFTSGFKDGLLGMNFLGNFKFKIDQREAILYLGKKGR
jgi:predicted aspartyl protease